MIILAILFCIGFILMCIVGFFHAMIKNRREEKALQYDSSAKYDGVYKPLYDPDTYDGIHDPEVIAVLKDCDEVCSRSPIKKNIYVKSPQHYSCSGLSFFIYGTYCFKPFL